MRKTGRVSVIEPGRKPGTAVYSNVHLAGRRSNLGVIASDQAITVPAKGHIALDLEAPDPPALAIDVPETALIRWQLGSLLNRFGATDSAGPIACFDRRERRCTCIGGASSLRELQDMFRKDPARYAIRLTESSRRESFER